jgi:hypothetical protein
MRRGLQAYLHWLDRDRDGTPKPACPQSTLGVS